MQVQSTYAENTASKKSVAGQAVRTLRKAAEPSAEVELNRVNLRTLVEGLNGLFVSIDYLKADGTARTLTGRLGVKAFLKGGQNKVEADERPYLTMFDIQLRQYRTVNLATVRALRSQGKKYRVIG